MSEIEKRPTKVIEAFIIGLTLSRLLLARNIASRTRDGISSTGRIGAFVIADIADGILARRWNVDTPLRRATDAVTDRLSTFVIAKAVYDIRPDTRTNLSFLAFREAVVGSVNAYHYIRTGEVVQGHGPHKIGSLSIAGFGAVATATGEVTNKIAGTGTNIINAILATDYISNAINPHGEVADGVRHIQFENLRAKFFSPSE